MSTNFGNMNFHENPSRGSRGSHEDRQTRRS